MCQPHQLLQLLPLASSQQHRALLPLCWKLQLLLSQMLEPFQKPLPLLTLLCSPEKGSLQRSSLKLPLQMTQHGQPLHQLSRETFQLQVPGQLPWQQPLPRPLLQHLRQTSQQQCQLLLLCQPHQRLQLLILASSRLHRARLPLNPRLRQDEARGQQGGVEEQPDQILHGLVRLARLQLLKFLLLILALDAKTLLRRALEFHAVKLHQLLHEQPDQILHGRGLVQVEARSQQGGIEEQPDQVLHGLVILARLQHLKILPLNLVLEDKTLPRRALEFIAVKLLQLLHASLNHGATMDRTSRPFFRRVPGKGMRTPA